ncbi:unnamed protein product, partial [Ectocarpus sp. 13 AM-2016]
AEALCSFSTRGRSRHLRHPYRVGGEIMPSVSGLVWATLLVIWAGLLLLQSESTSVRGAAGGVPAGDGAPLSVITGGAPYCGDTPSVNSDGVPYSGSPPWTVAEEG